MNDEEDRPKQIGTKQIVVDGKIYTVKVYEARPAADLDMAEGAEWTDAEIVN